jgi:5-oxoprolinase (ATP-hydrolysing)
LDRLWSFWIDRGGTFTDVIGQADDGEEVSLKLLSSSPAYEDAAVEAMRRVLGAGPGAPFPAHRVEAIKMGTTVATNALLERRGARTLFVATQGFADALIIGDQSRPDLFALNIVRPEPLYSGAVEARERLAADGAVVADLDRDDLAAKLKAAVAEGYTAAAIAFLHADLNPAHEIAAGALARAAGFEFVALSHEVSPLPRYIPRAETTVADAYLTPVLRAYVDKVAGAVAGAPLYFMTSAGGLVRASAFRGRDAVVSGPAGGVVGVANTARAAKVQQALGFDMGGTSTDVCRYAGRLERRDTATIAGVKLRSPMLDVETVAAGGGSILFFDGLRARVGPHSAGANPGPAAYGRGGPATVTDANLVLGRLDPRFFPAIFGPTADAPLDIEAARARLSELADAMGADSVEAAAEGFVAIAVEQTAQAVRRISTERGFDPRGHALVAFGGAAGQVGCQVAEALGVDEVLCPRHGSVLSAWGIGQARVTALKQAGLDAASTTPGWPAPPPCWKASRPRPARPSPTRAPTAARSPAPCACATTAPTPNCPPRPARSPRSGPPSKPPTAACSASWSRIRHRHRQRRGRGGRGGEHRSSPAVRSVPPSTLPRIGEGDGSDVRPRRNHLRPHRRRRDPDHLDGPALIVRPDTQIALPLGWRATAQADGLIRLTRAGGVQVRAIALDRPDPITLELFNRRFMGVAEAMGAALERTAHSVNIKERLDFSCALFDADGGLVANAPHMPVHLGSMGASVRAVRDRHPTLSPGDAFALNNPYAGGTHLPDITVVMPVFMPGARARPSTSPPAATMPMSAACSRAPCRPSPRPSTRRASCWTPSRSCAAAASWRPMRGASPGLDLALPRPRPQHRRPQGPDRRLPGRRGGGRRDDRRLRRRGGGRLHDVRPAERHGLGAPRHRQALQRRGPRAHGRRRPDRRGHHGGRRQAGEATLDFRQSADQLSSNFNAPSAIVDATALYVFRTLVDDDIPLNSGCLAPLNILTRPGSMLAPAPPAAVVAGNVETSQHVVDALYAALGVMANAQGSMNNFTFGDETRQYYETLCGGAGATADADGASAVHTHMTNSRLTDPEILERRFPVRVETYEIRTCSGGDGLRRGGDGAVRRVRFLAPMEAALLSTRRAHAPQGISGGGPALRGEQRLITPDGAVKELPGCFSVTVQLGDVIEIKTPGGGGFGSRSAS